jgi:thiamine biosynthesis lipoprotein
MGRSEQETRFVNGKWDSIPGIRRFQHEAMATTFQVIILHKDGRYAEQAAQAAFDELDRLEGELSRFIENSDISRINDLVPGQPLRVGLDTFECLRLSSRLYEETNGAFDITVGALVGCYFNKDKTARTPSKEELNTARRQIGLQLLQLDEGRYSVLVTGSVDIDLGGIGKGYALDKMAELLRDWSIDNALIHGGYSSVLALDGPPETKGWPVTLSHPLDCRQTLARLCLQGGALSGSGLQKGQHIIDPRTARPVEGRLASWASAADAATADALSTAFMVMSADEVEEYCLCHADVSAMIIAKESSKKTKKDKILRFGWWDGGGAVREG